MSSSRRAVTRVLAIAVGIAGWTWGGERAATAQDSSSYNQYPESGPVQPGAPAAVSAPPTVAPPLTDRPAVPGSTVPSTKTTTTTTTPAPEAPAMPAPATTTTTTTPGMGAAPSGEIPATPPATTTTTTTTPAVPGAPMEPAPPPSETNVYIEQPPTPAPVVVPVVTPAPKPYRPRVGAGLLVGGGVFDFARERAQNDTNTGAYWNVRAVVGTRQFLGLEAAYVGSAQAINTLGLSNDAALVSNGVEGNLRLNIPVKAGDAVLEPFGFVGMGWSHYSVMNSSTVSSSISDSDDVLAVPFGAGFGYAYHGFVADTRFTYRPTYYNDLLRPVAGGGSSALDNWSVGAQLGFEF